LKALSDCSRSPAWFKSRTLFSDPLTGLDVC
jgi:hypothetical protein